jgi:hypothetical protein
MVQRFFWSKGSLRGRFKSNLAISASAYAGMKPDPLHNRHERALDIP